MKCKNCNKKDAVKYSVYSTGEFCCRECARAFSTKSKRKQINESVSIKLTGIRRNLPKIEIVCKVCSTSVFVKPSKSKQICCSKSCAATYRNINGVGRIAGLASVSAQSESRRSKNEIYFGELCAKQFIDVKFNEPMFNGWDADIIIEDMKIAVLWNGKWHYEKIKEKHSVEQVQNRDLIKMREIEGKGYKYYVIKDMGKYNKLFVENKFKDFLVYLKLIS